VGRRAHVVGRRHRLTQWIGPANQGFIAVGAGATALISSAPFEEAATLVRTRGQLSIRPEDFVADIDIVGAVGMGIVSAEAFAAGVASIPTPFTDADWGGWFVWRAFSYRYNFASAVGENFPNWTMEIDSKAMRKISPNERIVTIAEAQGAALRVSVPTRLLIKLS